MTELGEKQFSERFLAALEDWMPPRADLLARHAWLVRERNEHLNLTRIVEPEEMAHRHVLDSLAAAPILAGSEEAPVRRVLDLGTGAGWPGLALAIALPDLRVTLLDGRKKKIDFLDEVVRDLGLEHQVDCVWGRFEDWMRPRRKDYDMVLARAVGPLEKILGWTTNAFFGPLLLWKGPSFDEELAAAQPIMRLRKLEIALDLDYEVPGSENRRRLVIVDWA